MSTMAAWSAGADSRTAGHPRDVPATWHMWEKAWLRGYDDKVPSLTYGETAKARAVIKADRKRNNKA